MLMKSDFLSRILEHKQQEVEAARRETPEARLRDLAEAAPERRPFEARLAARGAGGVNIIAEIKRGSPSKGAIRADLDPAVFAACYERGGAAAVSVLTDRAFFNGGLEDLATVRNACGLPLLRKDFVISHYQIYEAAARGADAVLLIVRALDPDFLRTCIELCDQLRLGALVEIHSAAELDLASRAGARIIGINNRDLSTFKTDIQTSIDIAANLSVDQVAVAESGIHERGQIERLLEAGLWNFLIGESLVRSPDPELFLGQLMGKKGI